MVVEQAAGTYRLTLLRATRELSTRLTGTVARATIGAIEQFIVFGAG